MCEKVFYYIYPPRIAIFKLNFHSLYFSKYQYDENAETLKVALQVIFYVFIIFKKHFIKLVIGYLII